MLNHAYTIIGIVSIMLVIFGYGYKQGRDSMIDKITAQKLDYAQKIIRTERDYQNEQNRIVADYLQQIHEMGEMYENEKIKADNLRDTVTFLITPHLLLPFFSSTEAAGEQRYLPASSEGTARVGNRPLSSSADEKVPCPAHRF